MSNEIQWCEICNFNCRRWVNMVLHFKIHPNFDIYKFTHIKKVIEL